MRVEKDLFLSGGGGRPKERRILRKTQVTYDGCQRHLFAAEQLMNDAVSSHTNGSIHSISLPVWHLANQQPDR